MTGPPPLPCRIRLTAIIALFVVGDRGDDATPDGTTPDTGFATIQGAVDAAYARYDAGGHMIQIEVVAAAGPFTAPTTVTGPLVGGGFIRINGFGGAAALVTVGRPALTLHNAARVTLANVAISTSGPDVIGVFALLGARLSLDEGVSFGPCTGAQIDISESVLRTHIGWTITGGARSALHCTNGAMAALNGGTVTLVGTPHFSGYFCGVADGNHVMFFGTTFVGAATGCRYLIHYLSSIRTFAGSQAESEAFLPGDRPGLVQRGSLFDSIGASPVRENQLKGMTADFTLPLPAMGRISAIVIQNTSNKAILGGVNVGTAPGGADIVCSAPLPAHSFCDAPPLKRLLSTGLPTTIHVSAGEAWNGAVVTFTLVYYALASP